MAAQQEQGASKEQMRMLLEAVLKEHQTFNVWPRGF